MSNSTSYDVKNVYRKAGPLIQTEIRSGGMPIMYCGRLTRPQQYQSIMPPGTGKVALALPVALGGTMRIDPARPAAKAEKTRNAAPWILFPLRNTFVLCSAEIQLAIT